MAIVLFINLTFILTLILIIASTLKINIKEFELTNKKINKFQVVVSLALFNKYNWLKLKIDNQRINKVNKKIKKHIFNKLLNTRILTKFKSMDVGLIKKWKQIFNKMNLESINYYLKIGTEDACITAYTVGIISSFTGVFFLDKVRNLKFCVEPVYIDKNYVYLSLNCIFDIKLIHIINRKKF